MNADQRFALIATVPVTGTAGEGARLGALRKRTADGVAASWCIERVYAIQQGLPEDLTMELIHTTLIAITLSILVHA